MNADANTIAVIWFLILGSYALGMAVLSWLEGRNTKKQAENVANKLNGKA